MGSERRVPDAAERHSFGKSDGIALARIVLARTTLRLDWRLALLTISKRVPAFGAYDSSQIPRLAIKRTLGYSARWNVLSTRLLIFQRPKY